MQENLGKTARRQNCGALQEVAGNCNAIHAARLYCTYTIARVYQAQRSAGLFRSVAKADATATRHDLGIAEENEIAMAPKRNVRSNYTQLSHLWSICSFLQKSRKLSTAPGWPA
jgi:hypothetical protein